MNILIFGAAGKMGQLLTQEALSRGHKVTAVVRDPAKFKTSLPNLKVVPGDATDLASIAKIAPGNESPSAPLAPRVARRAILRCLFKPRRRCQRV